METSVEFDSALFEPFLPEDSQVNPEVYGAELAFWLSRKLAERGVVTSYPEYEDWGWYLEYATDEEDEYSLCCGNCEGSKSKWRCFLDSKSKGLFRRSKSDPGNASALLEALRAVLSTEPSISNIAWSTEP
jgi:hypothetical protein